MVTHNNKLEIFERFEIDYNLPKHKNGTKVELGSSILIQQGTSNSWGDGIFISGGLKTAEYHPYNPKRVWKIFKWLKRKKEEVIAIKLEKKKNHTILEFFSSLATSLTELKTLTDIAIHYEIAISNAIKAGQIALSEQLKERLNPAKSEAQLVSYGLNKYLSEEQIVDFYTKAQKDRNLKLTWIKNFIKPIPSKILDIKVKLDETYVFDNYVILHYDPNNDATNLTKKEVEELKKDPILFGVINKSRRLYYIGDWIDEYCDLTLDTVIETLGENVGEINNETVKTFIDRGFQNIEKIVPLPPEPPKNREYENLTPPDSWQAYQNNLNKIVDDVKSQRRPRKITINPDLVKKIQDDKKRKKRKR